eukprot:TRINITY_DN4939_c0_g1_i2.p1 TRINITY_DN4939_c0_g1~~TRINITY_DN4939_c0_g1_i2.p1  ORF type:complete len:610 (+),score=109.37 TRINITY_DN4939_c0_g1_i2:63-1832(+)
MNPKPNEVSTPVRKSAFSLARSQVREVASLGTKTVRNEPSDREKEGTIIWKSADERVFKYDGPLKQIDPNAKESQLEEVDAITYARHCKGEPYSKFIYPMGDYYEGEWKSNKRTGYGLIKMGTGYRYEGNWNNDTPEGQGSETFTRGEHLKGTYHHGNPQKVASLYYNPRDDPKYRYHGHFRNGQRHGRGVITYGNGDVTTGVWKDGKRDGPMITIDGKSGRKYRSIWKEDKLLSGPDEIPIATEVDTTISGVEPEPELGTSAGHVAADFTKWKVQEDATFLTLEHFHRLKAGFELLDDDCSGELSIGELSALWGSKDQHMLKKLDRNKDGQVSLYEILVEWYPNVKRQLLQRYVDLEPQIATIHRLRGNLAGVVHPSHDGFYSLTGGEMFITDEMLTQAKNLIGGEKFGGPLWQRACALRNPPSFIEMLEAWYPNTPRCILERYEISHIPNDELEDCWKTFKKMDVKRVGALEVELFVNARHIKTRMLQSPPSSPTKALVRMCTAYFFKHDPCWIVGKYIKLTVPMLRRIVSWTPRPASTRHVTFPELMRYAFPGVPCTTTQEILGKRSTDLICTCDICVFCRSKGLA